MERKTDMDVISLEFASQSGVCCQEVNLGEHADTNNRAAPGQDTSVRTNKNYIALFRNGIFLGINRRQLCSVSCLH